MESLIRGAFSICCVELGLLNPPPLPCEGQGEAANAAFFVAYVFD